MNPQRKITLHNIHKKQKHPISIIILFKTNLLF